MEPDGHPLRQLDDRERLAAEIARVEHVSLGSAAGGVVHEAHDEAVVLVAAAGTRRERRLAAIAAGPESVRLRRARLRVVLDERVEEQATRGDLDKVSLDTQVWLAKKAQELATGDKKVNLALPVPGVPDLAITVNFKGISEVAKGKPQGFGLTYEVYRW